MIDFSVSLFFLWFYKLIIGHAYESRCDLYDTLLLVVYKFMAAKVFCMYAVYLHR